MRELLIQTPLRVTTGHVMLALVIMHTTCTSLAPMLAQPTVTVVTAIAAGRVNIGTIGVQVVRAVSRVGST